MRENYGNFRVLETRKCISTWNLSKICPERASLLSKIKVAILREKHTVCTGEYLVLLFWCRLEKNQVTHHLAHHQYSNHFLFVALVRQGVSNWRHYTFVQKATAIAKMQAYPAYRNFIKWKNACVMVDKQLEEKKGIKKSTHDGVLLPLLGPITGELPHFF